VDVENVSNGSVLEAPCALGVPEPKKLKRQDARVGGAGGKGAEDSSQRRRFLPLFHRYGVLRTETYSVKVGKATNLGISLGRLGIVYQESFL
jgi:hypothetical protein